MDDVIGDTQATFGMISTIRAMLDDAVRELNRGDPRRPLETHSMLQPMKPYRLCAFDDAVTFDQRLDFILTSSVCNL